MSTFLSIAYGLATCLILFYYIPRIRKLISEINILRLSLEVSQRRGDMYHRQYINEQESVNIGLALLGNADVEIRSINNTRDRLEIEIQEIRNTQAAIVSESSHLTTEIQRLNAHVRVYQNQLRTQNIPEPSPQEITDLVNAEIMINQNTASSLQETTLNSRYMQESLRRVISTGFIAPPLSSYPRVTEDDSRITESDEQRRARLTNIHSVRGTMSMAGQIERERNRLVEIARLSRLHQAPLAPEEAGGQFHESLANEIERPLNRSNGLFEQIENRPEYQRLDPERWAQFVTQMGVRFINDPDEQREMQEYFNAVQEQTFQSIGEPGTLLTPQEYELSDKIEELSAVVVEKDQLITLLKNLIREFHSNSVYKESDGDKRRYRLPISIAITVEELLNK